MTYKKLFVYLLSFLMIFCMNSIIVSAIDSLTEIDEVTTSETNNSYLSPLLEEVNNVEKEKVNDVIEIINSCAFDKDTVMSKGSKEIAEIAAHIDAFNYWQDADIIDFKWLHSFETGSITHALFELLGKNGQYGHMVYDCENEDSDSFAACESPYAMAEKKLNTNSSVIISSDDDIYYFYTGISYGCGKVNEKGLMDIYNIHSLLLEDNSQEIEALYDVSFCQSKTEKENVIRERTIVGKEESIREYELRRSELNTSKSINEVEYPDSYLIANVPDYQQSSGCTCIPTSMANIIGYWDQNGYPNLVPSNYDSKRENYIKTNIVECLSNAGSTTSNSSIDPAFEEYIADNGNYKYNGVGIWNPNYDDLMAEMYSFECPCLIGFPYVYGGAHCTTGVGYEWDFKQKVIVHDNWSTTAIDVYRNWSDVDYMFSCSIRNRR